MASLLRDVSCDSPLPPFSLVVLISSHFFSFSFTYCRTCGLIASKLIELIDGGDGGRTWRMGWDEREYRVLVGSIRCRRD